MSASFNVQFSNYVRKEYVENLKKELGIKKDSELLKKLMDSFPRKNILSNIAQSNCDEDVRVWAMVVYFNQTGEML